MTRKEWAAAVDAQARALADETGAAWPTTVRLHDRHAGGGLTWRYAISVHGGTDPHERTLILWTQRSDSDAIYRQAIGESLWQQLALGAAELGWSP